MPTNENELREYLETNVKYIYTEALGPDGKCLSCQWYSGNRNQHQKGQCRINAPSTYRDMPIWPEVMTEDFCGEYDYYGNYGKEE